MGHDTSQAAGRVQTERVSKLKLIDHYLKRGFRWLGWQIGTRTWTFLALPLILSLVLAVRIANNKTFHGKHFNVNTIVTFARQAAADTRISGIMFVPFVI